MLPVSLAIVLGSFVNAPPMFTLHAPAFRNGEVIPVEFTCEGTDQSPELIWESAPAGTKSFVLICDDPDAPGGVWTHWVAFDIPSTVTSLPAHAKHPSEGLKEGTQSSGTVGYHGPCPPRGHGAHRYFFTLYALDRASLGLRAGAAREAVEHAMEGHVLGTASIMGRFERK